MRTPITRAVVLLALPTALTAQEVPRPKTADGEPPLPPGAVMRLGDTRFRPGARIWYLAFSPDGTRLASWGHFMNSGQRLSIWDTATGREVFTRTISELSLEGMAWGRDGGFAVLSGAGGTRVWAFADAAGKFPSDDSGPAPPIPAGPKVVAGPIVPDRVRGRMALSADGTRLAVVPSGGGSVQLLPTKVGTSVADLKPIATSGPTPSGACSALHFVRGTKAVVVLTQTATGQSAVVWDMEKNTVSEPVAVPMGVRQGERQSLDVADDGSALAVGMNDGTVQVFDLPSGKERLSVKKHDGPKHGGRWSEVSVVKFVNGGRNVLSAGRDNRQLVWDARTGADVAALNGHPSWVEAVAVSADGKRVATAGQDSLIRLWDPATWKPVLPPEGPRETVWRLEVSRDGRYVAAGSGSGAHVWELGSGKEVRAVASDYRGGHVLFSPEGALLTGDGKGALTQFPIPAGEPKRLAIKGRLLDFTPDAKTLLTAEGASVLVWDWPAGTQRRAIPVKGEALSAAVSTDSRTAVVGLSGKPAVVVDLESGSVRDTSAKLHWFARAAGFLAGGKVACGTVGTAQAEAWVVGTGARARQFEQPPARPHGHFYQLSLAVSPDGRRAATSHSDGGLAVYETATGQVLAHFAGHRDSVISIAWAGGDRVLSAGGDHQVLVWDASLRALAGKVAPLPAADRPAAWDRLGSQAAKEAIKAMAALAAEPDGAVTLIGERLKPVAAADPATLDRIFRDLDAPGFAAREKASRELAELGVGAVAGVRERVAKAPSAEVRGRAEAFLKKFAAEDLTPDRVRYLRALDVLAAADTPAARQLVERLAGGAAEVWETEAARQALRSLPPRPAAK